MTSKIKQAQVAISTAPGEILHKFMSLSQRKVLEHALRGEEGDHFAAVILEMKARIEGMPKTYETDGHGKAAKIHLHYFKGGIDAWVTEKDVGDGDGKPARQLQAFGAVNLGFGAEMGYVNIEELLFNGLELDLHWDCNKTLGDVL